MVTGIWGYFGYFPSPYNQLYTIDLGPKYIGKTLTAQLIDEDGNDYNSLITEKFTEIGSGFYLFQTTLEEEFTGAIKILDGNTLLDVYTVKYDSDKTIAQTSVDNVVTTLLAAKGFTSLGEITLAEVLALIVGNIKGKI